MATAKGGYHTKDGLRVPSVTTILGRFKESGALIHWSAGQAAQYVINNIPETPTREQIVKLCEQAKHEYRNVRDDAASAGTMAHEAVERWIKKEPITFDGKPEVTERAQKAFDAFLEWAKQTHLEVTQTEMALVSNVHGFGGTLDAMMVNGKRSLGDWKTSNGVYGEYLCQIAAYGILWEENFPDQTIDGGYHLLRFDKTYGDFKHHWWSELDTAKRSFLLMRELYENDKELKKRAA